MLRATIAVAAMEPTVEMTVLAVAILDSAVEDMYFVGFLTGQGRAGLSWALL